MKRFSRSALCAPVSMAVSLALASAAGLAQAAQAGAADTAATPAQKSATQHRKAASRKATAAVPAPAASAASLQEVVIQAGIVGGIENSLQAEKLSNEIVEVVSAEDIG